ncbi:MAG: hypothetical protein HQL80_12925 [Magnetococcales bacterium]|nr:hypothetical protein [Magnetococcales bacterium]
MDPIQKSVNSQGPIWTPHAYIDTEIYKAFGRSPDPKNVGYTRQQVSGLIGREKTLLTNKTRRVGRFGAYVLGPLTYLGFAGAGAGLVFETSKDLIVGAAVVGATAKGAGENWNSIGLINDYYEGFWLFDCIEQVALRHPTSLPPAVLPSKPDAVSPRKPSLKTTNETIKSIRKSSSSKKTPSDKSADGTETTIENSTEVTTDMVRVSESPTATQPPKNTPQVTVLVEMGDTFQVRDALLFLRAMERAYAEIGVAIYGDTLDYQKFKEQGRQVRFNALAGMDANAVPPGDANIDAALQKVTNASDALKQATTAQDEANKAKVAATRTADEKDLALKAVQATDPVNPTAVNSAISEKVIADGKKDLAGKDASEKAAAVAIAQENLKKAKQAAIQVVVKSPPFSKHSGAPISFDDASVPLAQKLDQCTLTTNN